MSEIAIIVPMLGRAESVDPLIESIRAAAAVPQSVTFVCSPEDEEVLAAVRSVAAEHIVVDWEPGVGDFARKTNAGFRQTIAPWVFLGASDLKFERGWDETALIAGEAKHAGVVGTNDDAHPLVRRGGHATHSLIRRAYVEEFGSATIDGQGEVYCELYDHSWVDNELVAVAQARRQWVFARGSVVRHLHPHWGTAPMDATYEKGMRAIEADRQLYIRRLQALRMELRKTGRSRRAVL